MNKELEDKKKQLIKMIDKDEIMLYNENKSREIWLDSIIEFKTDKAEKLFREIYGKVVDKE